MRENRNSPEPAPLADALVVVQLSPRRWAVARRYSLPLALPEYRIITRPITSRIDAQAICQELLIHSGRDLSLLAREHLLTEDSRRNTGYYRSSVLAELRDRSS
jgi:hypothetical protein